jgi:hypothetical protein
MEQPKEFKQLAMDTLSARLFEMNTEDEVRNLILGNLDPLKRRSLQAYLTEILDGRCSDAELTALWDKTGTDIMFYTPGGARKYLLKVAEWLSQNGAGR